MNSLWPSANVVNATIPWSWTIVLSVYFSSVIFPFFFFVFQCRYVSFALRPSSMLFYCRICWLHYVMNNRHILWLSHKITSASDLVLVTLFSVSFLVVCLRCCCCCFFSGGMQRNGKVSTDTFYWPSTDNFIILVAEHEHNVCECAFVWLLQLHANRRTCCDIYYHSFSFEREHTHTHSSIQLQHVKRLMHLKIISCSLDAKKEDFVQCCINLWYIVANMLEVCMIYTSNVYGGAFMCMRSQWEKTLNTLV